MATHSSILALKIPCTEEPGRLQSKKLQRVGHDWVTEHTLYIYLDNLCVCTHVKSYVLWHESIPMGYFIYMYVYTWTSHIHNQYIVHFRSHASLRRWNFFLFIFLPFSEYSLPLFPNFLLKVALRRGCQDLRLQTHCFPMLSSGNLIRGEPSGVHAFVFFSRLFKFYLWLRNTNWELLLDQEASKTLLTQTHFSSMKMLWSWGSELSYKWCCWLSRHY